MFFSCDMENFPIVVIKFKGYIHTNNEFELFLKTWYDLYTLNENFILIFDTLEMELPHIKYSFKMTAFIKSLRKKNPQYLQKSYIIIENRFIKSMLNFVFFIQPPVATVYLTNESLENVVEKVKNGSNNVEIVSTFLPKKPFIPFL
jgi:hypothetical protein